MSNIDNTLWDQSSDTSSDTSSDNPSNDPLDLSMKLTTEKARSYVELERRKGIAPVWDTATASGISPFTKENMPKKILEAILSLLDQAELTLFSLTCKDALKIVRGLDFGKESVSQIEQALRPCDEELNYQRTKFLTLLADDHPYLYVCENCAKLHTYHHSFKVLNEDGESTLNTINNIRGLRDPSCKGLITFGPLWPQWHMPFHAVRLIIMKACARYNTPKFVNPVLVMNTLAPNAAPVFVVPELDMNGRVRPAIPTFEVPELTLSDDWQLRKLGNKCVNTDAAHGFVKLDVEAVIVRRCLFLHRIHRVVLYPQFLEKFLSDQWCSDNGPFFRACGHEFKLNNCFWPKIGDYFGYQQGIPRSVDSTVNMLARMAKSAAKLPEAPGPEGWDMSRYPRNPDTLPGCADCLTDCAVTIHHHPAGFGGGVEVVFDVFQELGTCDGSMEDSRGWALAWNGQQQLKYNSASARRKDGYKQVDPRIFPTRPGRSGRDPAEEPFVPNAMEQLLDAQDCALERRRRPAPSIGDARSLYRYV
ncbi:hypothetical protein GGR54DRAFT_591100 [Hypoxylon sp. NC1633]|nr:hypothetical protein GGR54DRAFT_591100 [Hypoxylon sp. NC1633]